MLSYHVAYWDYLGWNDPFGNKRWGDRQKEYCRAWNTERRYTPMMIVDGETHMHDQDKAKATIEEHLQRDSKFTMELSAEWDKGRINVFGWFTPDSNSPDLQGARIYCALAETNLRTECDACENEGKTLVEHAVVRSLQAGEEVQLGRRICAFQFPAQRDWDPENLRAVVFIQNPKTMKTLACFETPVNPPHRWSRTKDKNTETVR